MEDHNFNIRELEKRLEELNLGSQKETSEVWKRFDDLINKMSEDQKAYVGQNDKVINKRKEMIQTFNDWLFEKYKGEFVEIPAFAAIAQEYVEATASTAQDYGARANRLEQENEDLRRQLNALREKQIGGDML